MPSFEAAIMNDLFGEGAAVLSEIQHGLIDPAHERALFIGRQDTVGQPVKIEGLRDLKVDRDVVSYRFL